MPSLSICSSVCQTRHPLPEVDSYKDIKSTSSIVCFILYVSVVDFAVCEMKDFIVVLLFLR